LNHTGLRGGAFGPGKASFEAQKSPLIGHQSDLLRPQAQKQKQHKKQQKQLTNPTTHNNNTKTQTNNN
jgi:molybdopterin-guanine dinucleotide biosynthesis protein A